MRSLLCLVPFVAACAQPPAPEFARAPAPFQPDFVRGASARPPGRVVVLTNTCSSLDGPCPRGWSDSVDNLVTSALDFRGYPTVDPTTLHNETLHRDDTTESLDDKVTANSSSETVGRGGAIIGIIPVLSSGQSTESHSVTVHVMNKRTIQLEGAQYEDLRVEDQQHVLGLVNAQSIITTKLIVSSQQTAEILVKLSSASDGSMIWSARCAAAGGPIEQSIEHATRCAVSAIKP